MLCSSSPHSPGHRFSLLFGCRSPWTLRCPSLGQKSRTTSNLRLLNPETLPERAASRPTSGLGSQDKMKNFLHTLCMHSHRHCSMSSKTSRSRAVSANPGSVPGDERASGVTRKRPALEDTFQGPGSAPLFMSVISHLCNLSVFKSRAVYCISTKLSDRFCLFFTIYGPKSE